VPEQGGAKRWSHAPLEETAQLRPLLVREGSQRIGSALERDEGLGDPGMELAARMALDLGERDLRRHPVAVRAVARHRVVAVGHDQEVGGQRNLLRFDAVVAAPVHALVVVLDRARLSQGEAKAAQQPRRETGMETHRGPLPVVELAGLAQHGRVDRDLAEVVQTARPAQARNL
jgi:hypothetical protein